MTKDDKLQWFPFYHARFIRDTAQWNDTEIGIYIKLLCSQWVNGSLINDEERIRNLTNQSPEAFKNIWEFMKVKFPKNKKGNLQNTFLEIVRKHQEKIVGVKSTAGSAGAEARWGAPLVMPFDTQTFKDAWELWKKYKKETFRFSYKTKISEQAALKKLSELSGGSEDMANKIILQALEFQWQGLYPLKNNYGQKFNNTGTTVESLIVELRKRT